METIRVDTNGMRCPQPVLMLAHGARGRPPGTIIEILGDCPTFEKDVRGWVEREKKTVLAVLGRAPRFTMQIRL